MNHPVGKFVWGLLLFIISVGRAVEPARILYIVNSLGRTLTAVDLASGTVRQDAIQTGQMPSQILVRGGELLVLNSSPAELTILDGTSLQVNARIALPEGSNPYQMALAQNGRLYVTLLLANSLAVVDLAQQSVVRIIPVGAAPQGVLIAGGRIWVANTGGYPDYTGSSLSCLDLEDESFIAELPMPANPQVVRAAPVDYPEQLYVLCSGAWGAGEGTVQAVTISRDGAAVEPVLSGRCDIGGYPGDLVVLADERAMVCEWGDESGGLLSRFNPSLFPADPGIEQLRAGRGAMRFFHDAPAGDLYLCAFDEDQVQKIDPATGAVLASWPVGDGPVDLALFESPADNSPSGGIGRDPVSYPNPFTLGTTIRFTGAGERARLRIYAVTGRLVLDTVMAGLVPGSHEFFWDGRETTGRPAASGVYFGVAECGGEERCWKMTLLR